MDIIKCEEKQSNIVDTMQVLTLSEYMQSLN